MGDAGIGEEFGQHRVVEGDLEALLDLRARRTLHVGDQDVQHAADVARQAEDVDVAAQQPAVERHLEAGLEEDQGCARREGGGLAQDARIVIGPARARLAPIGEVDRRAVRADRRLDPRLEVGPGAG